jgi:hypothetical protein
VFPEPQELNVSVGATDSAGNAAPPSPETPFQVFGLPTVGEPVASRASLDLGQTVNLTTTGTGGSGVLVYDWAGLPGGCTQTQTSSPKCVAESSGSYTIAVDAVDRNGGLSVLSDAIELTVFGDPTITTPTLSASSVVAGAPVTIQTVASGGSGGLQLAWSGLPDGCGGAGAVLDCQPSVPGTYSISVAVTDSNGFRTLSSEVTLVVASAPPGPATTIGGLSVPMAAGLVAGIAALGVIGAIALRRRHAR